MDDDTTDAGKGNSAQQLGFNALALSFPTDAVTVRQLIDRYPESFQWDWETFGDLKPPREAITNLVDAMHMERELAELAFAAASDSSRDALDQREPVSRPGRSSAITRPELVDLLSLSYVWLGVSSGRAASEELIRVLESAAAAQAPDGPAI